MTEIIPCTIDMDMEMPNDADPAEWDAFVSWYNTDGCEHAIAFFHNLWKDRDDYRFKQSEWHNTAAGLSLSPHEMTALRQDRDALERLKAEHRKQIANFKPGSRR